MKCKCSECGKEFASRQYNAEFCSGLCRNTFNNRRQQRGATLYDLEMLTLADPDVAAKHELDRRRKNLIRRWMKDDAKRTWKRPRLIVYDTLHALDA